MEGTTSNASPPSKPHVSPTQLDMLCKCGEQYRRRYVEGHKMPPGIAAIKGKGLHGGAETNFRQKIESHKDLAVTEIQDAAVAKFEAEVAGGYVLTKEEEGAGAKNVIGKAKDDVVMMAGLHAREQAPDYQPLFVEQSVRIALPMCDRDLLGVVDLADDRRRVVDFKTSGKKKSQAEADVSVQLSTYAAAFKALTGNPPSEVRLDTIVRTKHETYRNLVVSTRNDGDLLALANRIDAVVFAIKQGVFTPALPGSWYCSAKWCGFWNDCRFVNSERRAAAEEE